MNPVLMSVYSLSEIVTEDYDEFYDFMISDMFESNIGECDYLIVNIEKILKCINENIDTLPNLDSDLANSKKQIKDFLTNNNLKAKDTLVFVQ
jgi:hypothetical protein